MQQVKQTPTLTHFDCRQMFDYKKIDSYAAKRSISHLCSSLSAFRNVYEKVFSPNPAVNYYSRYSLPEQSLLKKDLAELLKCINKSSTTTFQALSDIDRGYCLEHLLDNVYLTALGQNNMFLSRYSKYIEYRTELMRQALKDMGAFEAKNLEGIPTRYHFSKWHYCGLDSFSFKSDIGSISHKTKVYPEDYRQGIVYNHSWGYPKRTLLSDPTSLANYITNQSEVLDKVYFQTYIETINKMIDDGITEEEAKKAFPKP